MTTPVSFAIRPPPGHGEQSARSGGANGTASGAGGSGSANGDAGMGGAAPFRISAISAIPARPSPLSRSSTSGSRANGRAGQNGFGARGGAGLGDHDSDEEDAPRGKGRASRRDEEISGFGEDGIESLRKEKPAGPLVIPALPNKDWRNSSLVTRKPTYMPDSRAGRAVKPEDLFERTGDEPVRAGLQLTGSRAGAQDVVVKEEPDADDFDSNAADSPMANVKLEDPMTSAQASAAEETLEQKAMKALLTGQDGEAKPDLVIKMDEDTLDLRNMPADETDAFRRDVIMRPAESTLDDYEATPIEAFGEALLRGMGWQPNAATGVKIHEPKRRPDGLGLGAKERPAAGGAAGPVGKGKEKVDRSKRLGRGYVPVIKREKVESGPSGSDLSRNGTPSRASSRSPDSKDGRDSRKRRDDREGEADDRRGSSRYERDDRRGSERDDRYRDSKSDRRDDSRRERDRERDDGRRGERSDADRRRRGDDNHSRRHRDDRDSDRYDSRGSDRDGRRSERERDERDRYRDRR